MVAPNPRPAPVRGGLARPWWRDLPGWLLLWTLAAAVFVGTCSERRALHETSPQARAALFQRTWEHFHALCEGTGGRDFLSRCREQAHFLREFPECEVDCRARLEPWR
ncbi:hypothetical protein KH5H1_16870 [Corallococcus caeni]|uniref:hypothetical protein n=1 Tax=Corallococcus caeni TaxID=3082388 RepID=UPI0029581862|nr:hypothetical protein KH5H1_16870 [Corallococcus sp. KH5-1]